MLSSLPLQFQRNSRSSPGRRAPIPRTARRLLRHGWTPSRLMDEPTFMMHLDLELERARRHGRCFGLTRFEVDRIATRDTEIASRVVAQLRTCDVSTFVDDQLIVLWSESLPNEMPAAIERVVRTSAGSLRLAQSVAFPSSALTRTALLKDLMGRPPTIVPVQSAVDANVTSNGSDRLAG